MKIFQPQAKIAQAQRVRGIKLDFAALRQQLAGAKAALADADGDLSAGNFDSALQKARNVQERLNDGEKTIADAVRAATNRKK